MTRPLFSIIIPTYNRAEKLRRALISLNRQTLQNFEVLVCDDGSNDHTRMIVDEMRPKITFRSLNYFFEPNWGGPARPRNIGIKNASSDWICFLDSDDCWYPEKLKAVLPYLNSFDVIYHDFDLVKESGKIRRLHARQLKPPVFEDLMLNGHNGCIVNSGACVKRRLILEAGGLSENRELISVEDADLWLRIARLTDKFKHVRKRLGLYYLDGGNITLYDMKMINRLQLLFRTHAQYIQNQELRLLAARTNDYHLGRIMQKSGRESDAFLLYKSSLGSPNAKIVFRSLAWLVFIKSRNALFRRTLN